MADGKPSCDEASFSTESASSFRRSVVHLHGYGKAFAYAAVTTFAILICLSNSLTAAAEAVWSDCGNNWAYMWGWLLARFTPRTLFIGGTFATQFALYWIYSLTLAVFDLYFPSVLARFKVQPGTNQPLDKAAFVHTCKVVLCNQLFVSFPMLVLMWPIAKWRGMSVLLPLPSFQGVMWHIAGYLLVEELFFYYTHRLLHHPRFYWIHKVHHEWNAPIGVAALYSHPIEQVANTVPVLAGPLIFGSHLCVFWVWGIMAVLNTINSHSGLHLPFFSSPEAHDFHHLRFDVNFGMLGVLDYLHGTDVEFRNSLQYENHTTLFSTEYKPVIGEKGAKSLHDTHAKVPARSGFTGRRHSGYDE